MQNTGGDQVPLGWLPEAGSLLARFAGSIGVLAAPASGLRPEWEVESTDDVPTAARITYCTPEARVLLVQTEPRAAVVARAGTVTDLASAVILFRHAVADAEKTPADLLRPGGFGSAEWFGERLAADRASRVEVEAVEPTEVRVRVGGTPVVGRQVAVADCTAIELEVRDQVIRCVGRGAVMADLHLRLVPPVDLLAILRA